MTNNKPEQRVHIQILKAQIQICSVRRRLAILIGRMAGGDSHLGPTDSNRLQSNGNPSGQNRFSKYLQTAHGQSLRIRSEPEGSAGSYRI